MSFVPMRSHGLTEKEMQAFQPVHDATGVPCYLDIAILQCRHMRLVIQNADLSDHHARVGQSTIRHMSDVPHDLLKTPETRPMMDPYCLVEHQGQIRKSKVVEGTTDPVWEETFRFQSIDCSISEDGEGCIVEPTQEEREANPPQLERIVIYVKNACVKTKAQKPNLGMAILSPTAISNLLLTDKPSWIGMVDEGGSRLANDLGHRTDIMVRARMSVYRKSTLTLAVFHAHDVGTGAHWNGFTQPNLGGVYLSIKHRREQRRSNIRHQMSWNEEYHFDIESDGNQRRVPGDVMIEMRCSPRSGGFILGACKLSASSMLRIGQAWVGWAHLDPEANMSNIKKMPSSSFLKEALNLDTPKIAVMLSWQNFRENIQSHLWDLGPQVMERVAQEAYDAARIDKSVSQLAPLGKEITARIKQMYKMRYTALGNSRDGGTDFRFARAGSAGSTGNEFGRTGSSHSVLLEVDDTLDFTEMDRGGGGHQRAESVAMSAASGQGGSLLDGIASLWSGGGRGLEMCVTNLLSGATSMPCFWESEARRLREEQREEDREREKDEEGKRERSEVEETRFRRRERRGSLSEVAQLSPEELPVATGDMFLGVMLPDEYHL